MSKINKIYEHQIEKVWYDSSNVIYSECDDTTDDFKTLRIVFQNGRQYQYDKVNVNDYLLFRENLSQGKALNQYIKPNYEATRLDDVDVTLIKESINTTVENIDEPMHMEAFLDGDILSIFKDHKLYSQIVITAKLPDILEQIFGALNIKFTNIAHYED